MRYAHAYGAGILALAICATSAARDRDPVATLGVLAYTSADQAARAALRMATSYSASQRYEYGGVVIQCGSEFGHTVPITNKSSSSLKYDVELPDRCSIVALYHTHPSRDMHAHMHSQADMETARRLNVPSYIAVVATREVRVWKP